MNDTHLAVILSDIHKPIHDVAALAAVEKLLKHRQPEVIVQLGDLLDMGSLGHFVKHPKIVGTLQEEFDLGYEFWRNIREICPDSICVQIEGNHERRLQRELWNHPQFHSLRSMTAPAQLRLEELDVNWVPKQNNWFLCPELLITHGTAVRSKSGYSATVEMENRGVSGISGHVHRLSLVTRTNMRGTMTWCEAGHLLDLSKVDYMEGQANWQQGFAVVYFNDLMYQVQPIPVQDGRFVFEGRVYEG